MDTVGGWRDRARWPRGAIGLLVVGGFDQEAKAGGEAIGEAGAVPLWDYVKGVMWDEDVRAS